MSPNELGISVEELNAKLEEGRRRLLVEREKRVKPGRDEKILTSWNGLMLVGFALAGRILNREDFLKTARDNANFILQRMRRDGKLLRVYKDGQAKILGYLEDYANFIEGLLTLYEVTGESNWIEPAEVLTDFLLEQFWDPNESSFCFNGERP